MDKSTNLAILSILLVGLCVVGLCACSGAETDPTYITPDATASIGDAISAYHDNAEDGVATFEISDSGAIARGDNWYWHADMANDRLVSIEFIVINDRQMTVEIPSGDTMNIQLTGNGHCVWGQFLYTPTTLTIELRPCGGP